MHAQDLELTYDTLTEEYGLQEAVSSPDTSWLLMAAGLVAVILVGLGVFLLGRLFLTENWVEGLAVIRENLAGTVFWGAVVVGFLAQAVDGALGMAYGITATTFLLVLSQTRSLGMPRISLRPSRLDMEGMPCPKRSPDHALGTSVPCGL